MTALEQHLRLSVTLGAVVAAWAEASGKDKSGTVWDLSKLDAAGTGRAVLCFGRDGWAVLWVDLRGGLVTDVEGHLWADVECGIPEDCKA